MNTPPETPRLFNRAALRRARNRAAQRFENHDFLLEWAGANLADRLSDIKRRYPLALQIGARGFRKNPLSGHDAIEKLIVMDIAEKFCPSVLADEERLPFAPGVFDLVISPLSLHSVNDLPGALIQIRRALKPDGVFLGALLGGDTLCELRDSMMRAEIKIRGGVGPHIAPLAHGRDIGALMQRAGFALPVVDSETVTVTYGSALSLMRDLRFMGEGQCLSEKTRPLNKAVLDATEKAYRQNFPAEENRIRATFETVFVIGWAPHDSQPKPLRPGSACVNLADIL